MAKLWIYAGLRLWLRPFRKAFRAHPGWTCALTPRPVWCENPTPAGLMTMHRMPLWPRLIAFATLACAGLAPAHHTYAMFDTSREMSVSGVVARFEWKNPHTYLWVYVPGQAAGKYEAWAFENASPSLLSKLGWSKNSLKPDDKVTVIYAPLRSGGPGGHCLRITVAGGRNLACHGFDSAPAAAGR